MVEDSKKMEKNTSKTFINALLQKTLITNVYKVLSKKIAGDSVAQSNEPKA